MGRKFTFAEIVRAFDPLEIDFGHGVDIGVLHIESRSFPVLRECVRNAPGTVLEGFIQVILELRREFSVGDALDLEKSAILRHTRYTWKTHKILFKGISSLS
jgi:hypothetical protein